MYAANVRDGIFRSRTPGEIERLKQTHFMVRVKQSPIGGFSLVPQGEQWLELSALWAGTIRNGIGRIIMDQASYEISTKQQRAYALSTREDAIRAFRRHPSFREIGKLSEVKTRDETPEHLRSYDTSSRDPQLFLSNIAK